MQYVFWRGSSFPFTPSVIQLKYLKQKLTSTNLKSFQIRKIFPTALIIIESLENIRWTTNRVLLTKPSLVFVPTAKTRTNASTLDGVRRCCCQPEFDNFLRMFFEIKDTCLLFNMWSKFKIPKNNSHLPETVV
jgi:hypothetical protein